MATSIEQVNNILDALHEDEGIEFEELEFDEEVEMASDEELKNLGWVIDDAKYAQHCRVWTDFGIMYDPNGDSN